MRAGGLRRAFRPTAFQYENSLCFSRDVPHSDLLPTFLSNSMIHDSLDDFFLPLYMTVLSCQHHPYRRMDDNIHPFPIHAMGRRPGALCIHPTDLPGSHSPTPKSNKDSLSKTYPPTHHCITLLLLIFARDRQIPACSAPVTHRKESLGVTPPQ